MIAQESIFFGPRGDEDNPSLRIDLEGRFMLPDRREYSCRANHISTHAISVEGPHAPETGVWIVLYLQTFGRFEGMAIGSAEREFAIAFEASASRRKRIAAQIASLSHRGSLFREYDRIVPSRPASMIMLGNVAFPCEIQNISRTGAAIRSAVKLENKTKLVLGRNTKATVVRQTPDGFAVQFTRLLPLEIFDENIQL